MLLQACGVVIRAIHRHVVSSYVPVIDNFDTEDGGTESSSVPGSGGCSYRYAVSSYVPSIDNYDIEEVSHHLFQVLSDAVTGMWCRHTCHPSTTMIPRK